MNRVTYEKIYENFFKNMAVIVVFDKEKCCAVVYSNIIKLSSGKNIGVTVAQRLIDRILSTSRNLGIKNKIKIMDLNLIESYSMFCTDSLIACIKHYNKINKFSGPMYLYNLSSFRSGADKLL